VDFQNTRAVRIRKTKRDALEFREQDLLFLPEGTAAIGKIRELEIVHGVLLEATSVERAKKEDSIIAIMERTPTFVIL